MAVKLIINGLLVSSEGDRTFVRKNPITGDIACEAPAASVADAKAAVTTASAAFPNWSATSPSKRREILNAAADLMESRMDAFVQVATRETGATAGWIAFNVSLAANVLREAAGLTTHVVGETLPSFKPDSLSLIKRKARGVCLGIAPWNAPLILGTRAFATAIACGNTAILKASELCPETHLMIGQCLLDAGLPAGVLNVITNAPEDAATVVAALIQAPEVKHVNFTGSTQVGRIIGRLAGEHLKPALLELGGKAPMIILQDADLDGAVDAAVFGCFMNQGQICMSTERVIVEAQVADDFVARFAKRVSALRVGDPRGDVELGGLCTPGAELKLQALIEDALSKGAQLVCGGSNDGALMQATLLDHVTPEMDIYRLESFGPVKSIIRVDGIEEAIRVANDTEYGLSSAVFSQSIVSAMYVASKLETGICHINGPTVSDEPHTSFGGVKNSGFGRFGGQAGIQEFTDTQWLTIENPRQHYPI